MLRSKILFLIICMVVFSSSGRAEIPFNQARGMLTHTKDEWKQFSPFWAMVAIHGKMLERIRFYGHYKKSNKQNQHGEYYDVGEDSIARLIKELFNSPDGVQFVETTYEGTPVGNLSHHLNKINDIIEILIRDQKNSEKSTTVSAELQALLDQKSQIEKEISDENNKLSKLVAPKQAAISKNIGEEEKIREREQNKNKYLEEKKQYDETKRRLNTTIRQLKTNLSAVKKNIQREAVPEKVTVSDQDKIKAINDILGDIIPDELSDEQRQNNIQSNLVFAKLLMDAFNKQNIYANPDQSNTYLYPENIVITSLLSFFVKIADDADQLKDLPFLMKTKTNPDTQMIELAYNPKEMEFDAAQYAALKNRYIRNKEPNIDLLRDPELTFLMARGYWNYEYPYMEPIPYGSTTYHNAVFSDCGETSLRNVFGLFLSAFNNGKISFDAVDSLSKKIRSSNNAHLQEESRFQKLVRFFKTYKDIGAAASQKYRNAWAELVSDLNDGKEAQSLNDVYYGRQSQKNGPKDFEIYSNAKGPDGKLVDAYGIINMLNVIARIIPDEDLQASWSPDPQERLEQISKKLDRLCELLSRDGLKLSWENKDSENKIISEPFITITFMNGDIKLFDWKFSNGHFLLDTNNTNHGWLDNYLPEIIYTSENFMNEWIPSLFRNIQYDCLLDTYGHKPKNKNLTDPNYGKKFPLSLVYNPSLKLLNGSIQTLSWILDKKKVAYNPLILRWIDKTMPLDDSYTSRQLCEALMRTNSASILEELFQSDKFVEIYNQHWELSLPLAIKFGQFDVVKFLILKGADVNGVSKVDMVRQKDYFREINPTMLFVKDKWYEEYKIMPLYIAIANDRKDALKLLIENGADMTKSPGEAYNTVSKFESLYLKEIDLFQKALSDQNIDEIKKMLVADINPNYIFDTGMSPLHMAVDYGMAIDYGNKINVEILLEAGADIDIMGEGYYEGVTPLMHSVIGNDIEMTTFLLDHGADINAQAEKFGAKSALFYAASLGLENELKLLLSRGADINQTIYGTNETALSWVQRDEWINRYGKREIANILLSDPNIRQ